MIFKYIFIYILIIIIFYIINKYILHKDINEHYLTYFLPYYNNTNALTNFYKNNENNANYFKKKFDFRKINIGISDIDKYFAEALFKFYISNAFVVKVDVIKFNNRMSNINALYQNKLKFCLTDYMSMYHHHYHYVNNDKEKIRFITNLYKLYFYLFTKKQYNIFSYNDIKPDTRIGIVNNDIYSPSIYYYEKFFEDIGYRKDIDYIPIFYNTTEELFIGLVNNDCEIIFLIDTFPNNIINSFIEKYIREDIILLPFDFLNEIEFLNKNRILNIDYIDLNYLSESYFPKKFGKNIYTQNLPTLKILCSYKILLSHISVDSVYTYSFIKFYTENINGINSNIKNIGYKLKENNNDINHFIISDYHLGVRDYYYEKGYFTNINNDNCKYLVGKMECNEKTLKNNNLFL